MSHSGGKRSSDHRWGAFPLQRRWWLILPPVVFLTIVLLIPFLFVLKISLAESVVSVPPYTDLMITQPGGGVTFHLNFSNFHYLMTDDVYLRSYLYSVRTALLATLGCLLLGYPMAYAIARFKKSSQNLVLLLLVLPFWTSFLLRVYALEGLIRDNGLINQLLLSAHVIATPLRIMHTSGAVYLGIVYSYLPFMVLPLFATLEKLDQTLLEAAADLGSSPWDAFLDITLPLSMPGIVAGSTLVFIPAIGEFVIPSLLGGPNNLMIGRVLWDEFFGNHDWPVASAVAVATLVVVVGPMVLYQRFQARTAES